MQQVAIYCALLESSTPLYILVKRTTERGDFWQPLTGGVEDFDHTPRAAAVREAKEELGITISGKQIIDLAFSHKYCDPKRGEITEKCYGVILRPELKNLIRLSDEHTSIIYSSDVQYLKSIMKYEANRAGLERFVSRLTKNFAWYSRTTDPLGLQ